MLLCPKKSIADLAVCSCRHLVGESLLSPELVAHLVPGTDHTRIASIAESAFACCQVATEPGARLPLLNAITLCGGGACIPKLQDRFMSELRALLPHTAKSEMHRREIQPM